MRLRQRSGITGPNGASLEYPLSTARFIAPLKNTLIPSAGYGPATFTRTTTATYFDNEGMLKEVRTGAARFTGARRVGNLFPSSENFAFGWLATGSSIIGTNVMKVNSGTQPAYLYLNPAISVIANRLYTVKFRVIFNNHSVFQLCASSTGFGTGQFVNFDLQQSSLSATGCTAKITMVSTNTADLEATFLATVTTSSFVGVLAFETSLASARLASFTSDGTHSVYVVHAQCEDVTGQADQTASEYVHSGRVRPNYLTYTEDFTSSVWSNTNTTVTQNSIANPIDGRVNATKLQATSTSATLMSQNVVATGSTQTLSFYMKQGSGVAEANSFGIYNLTTLNLVVKASLNYSTKVVTISNGSGTINVTDVGSGWLLVNVTISGVTIGNSLSARIGFVNNSETSGVFCYVYGPSLVIDSSSTSYTPVGADYDPHGSGADGVKYFNTNKDGTPIPSGYIKGYLNEGARTNNLLWCRDLTNAAWVKTTMTTALTSTGICGQASAATRLTATAGNAKCVQTFTMASAARTFSAYVKRITGTGTVNITRDNGTSWTDITALLSTSAYTRVNIPGTSVTNPTCGFRIVTSGDAIDVDYCQDESDSFATNPISTTTVAVTRNSDLLYYYSANNISFTAGSALCNFSTEDSGSLTSRQMTTLATETNGKIIYSNPGDSHGLIRTYDGTNVLSSLGTFRNDRILKKATVSWSGTTLTNISEGSLSVSSGAFNGTMGSGSYLYIGTFSTATGSVLFGNIKDVYIWSNALTNNQMRQIVA
jgi:hypothetical protein